jgi:hypothetical protein
MNETVHTDIAVIGGGSAGVAAAVAAAREGLNVILIEKNSFLGGHATAAEVGTICGLYKFRKNKAAEYLSGRFARDFAEDLKQLSGTEPIYHSSGLHYLPYNIEVFKKKCVNLLNENKVDILLHAEIQSVKIRNEAIQSVSLLVNGELRTIQMRSVIDCSGDSTLSQLANLPLIRSEKFQASAQVFTVQNIGAISEDILSMVLMKELGSAIAGKKLPPYFDRVYIIPGSLKNSCVSLKIGIPIEVTNSHENLIELKKTAHSIVHRLMDYLIANAPLFKNASLLNIAPNVGIRVGLRAIGKYILNK